MSEKHLFARLFFTAFFLLCLGTQAMAQGEPDYFVYDDKDPYKIVGLKEAGKNLAELTIPETVTTVGRYAFSYDNFIPPLESLYILGNPAFEIDEGESALTDVKTTLSFLNLGSNMSLANIKAMLLNGYGQNDGRLGDIIIQDYLDTETGMKHGPVIWGYIEDENGEYSIGDDRYGIDDDDPINDVLTDAVRVTLPAEFVKNQIFGKAEIWGRFILTAALSTFCGEANFYDMDDGSNWLFYVPTELHEQDKEVYFKRVKIITEKEGVLIHNAQSTSQVVYLPRINEGDKYIEKNIEDLDHYADYEDKMNSIYNLNMLVGVIVPTPLQPTEDPFTNFILNKGTFYPTSGGTLGANRAYLQILTSDYEEMKNNTTSVNLSIVFEDKDEDAIQDIQISHQQSDYDAWFTIDGRKLSARPTLPGIYVNGGKKVIVGN